MIPLPHTRPLALADVDATVGSRFGGAPPSAVVETPCPRCGSSLRYLLTLESDLLGFEASPGLRALSWLLCRGGCLGRTATAGLVCLAHVPSPRGAPVAWQCAPTGRGLTADLDRPDVDATGAPLAAAKLGGTPAFLDEGVVLEGDEELLAQVPEELVLDVGGRLFGGGNGMLFCFARRDPAAGLQLAHARLAFEGG